MKNEKEPTTTIPREKYKRMHREALGYRTFDTAFDKIHGDDFEYDRSLERPCSAGELLELGKMAAYLMGFHLKNSDFPKQFITTIK